ncbi:hypothetical protein DERP_003188 [Dermatophagoides pteronyssinus]|uniref:Uncharacterized protein n=1 Tax=Dermatophagoides pteronyssinus TaxID=6956 RepID=A0ABQ8JIS5_DERPT|nr:hypothetical protein DERP_003188 [Dermatophagoides pteronyssinus]
MIYHHHLYHHYYYIEYDKYDDLVANDIIRLASLFESKRKPAVAFNMIGVCFVRKPGTIFNALSINGYRVLIFCCRISLLIANANTCIRVPVLPPSRIMTKFCSLIIFLVNSIGCRINCVPKYFESNEKNGPTGILNNMNNGNMKKKKIFTIHHMCRSIKTQQIKQRKKTTFKTC